MSMAKYDKYKDSGVDWLGSVPEQWEVRRIKDVVKVNPTTIKNVKTKNSLIEFLPMSNVNEITGTIKEYNFEPYENIKQGYTAFKNEDVLFAKITPCMENGNCVIVDRLQNNLGFGSTEFIVFRTDRLKLTNKHIYQFLRNARFLKKAENFMIGAAGQRRISSEYLKIHPIAIPALAEQTSIATYLDSKTSAFDSKIALLEQKITHYQQLRKSLINETVCRGLDKNVKLKDSGIEWIGRIPEHWEVKRMKDYFQISKRVVGKLSSNFRLLSLTQNGVIFRDLDKNAGKFPAEFDTYQVVNSNDLIFCLFDLDVTPRTVGYSEIYGMITGAYTIIFSDESKTFNKYYYYLYLLIDSSKNLSLFYTGLRNTIKKDTFLALQIPVPELAEQVAIATYLDEKTQNIDSIVSNIKAQIETLKELRKTLVNDVVTGKIKVSS